MIWKGARATGALGIGLSLSRWSDIAFGRIAVGLIALFVGMLVNGLQWKGLLVLLGLFVSLGVFGYALNDWNDRTADEIAGKPNSFTNVSPATAGVFLGAAATFALLFALVSPNPRITFILTILQLTISFGYCQAPIRLKEKGLWGIVAMVMAQYIVPSWIILLSVPSASFSDWVFLEAFALVEGLVLELGHQLYDYDGDLRAGVKTFAVRQGQRAVTRIYRVCLPILGTLIALCPVYIAWRLYQSGDARVASFVYLTPLVLVTLLQAVFAFFEWRCDPTVDPFYGNIAPGIWRLFSYLPNCFIPLYLAGLIALEKSHGLIALGVMLIWLTSLSASRQTFSTSGKHYGFRWHAMQILSLLWPGREAL